MSNPPATRDRRRDFSNIPATENRCQSELFRQHYDGSRRRNLGKDALKDLSIETPASGIVQLVTTNGLRVKLQPRISL